MNRRPRRNHSPAFKANMFNLSDRHRPHSSLDDRTQIGPTSIFLRSARRANPGRGSTYRRGIFVQTTGTSSASAFLFQID